SHATVVEGHRLGRVPRRFGQQGPDGARALGGWRGDVSPGGDENGGWCPRDPIAGGVGQRTKPAGSAEAGQEVGPRPGECCPRTDGDPAPDLFEGLEEATMTQEREADEVVAAAVDLLHERRLGADESVRFEDPPDLG